MRVAKKSDAFASAKGDEELVAEACGDSDFMTALGAAAAQHSGSGFGGHANEKAVDLRAAAAVGLECALRHESVSC